MRKLILNGNFGIAHVLTPEHGSQGTVAHFFLVRAGVGGVLMFDYTMCKHLRSRNHAPTCETHRPSDTRSSRTRAVSSMTVSDVVIICFTLPLLRDLSFG